LTFVYVAVTGRKIPILPILTGIGVAVSLYYVSALWHRYLCPYGTIMSITGSFAKHCWQVEKQSCIKCGACVKVCPADAVRMDGEESFIEIKKSLCLECTTCAQICPKNAIRYK
jgi:NAD-dependent dihydropyrimidine dehydrogenase PreA subunit